MTGEDVTAIEQTRHDEARSHLRRMRDRTEAARRAADAATEVDSEIVAWTLGHRLSSFTDDPSGVFFGSIDDGRDHFYVGRRHIEDELGDAFVIDWRAPAATPFYRATWADPMDLEMRKRHTIENHEVLAVFEEDFDDERGVNEHGVTGGGGVPDPLLAELERSRSGTMRDIVSTIQNEQDAVIRAPLEGMVIVQGGPGTGKTAVGLHRAAFLLYDHRETLDREGVLVVGPNQRFLRYISQVLPSLGEHAVTQLTVDGVASTRKFPKSGDSDDAANVKGSPAMAEVVDRLVTDQISPAEIEAPLGHRVVRLTEQEVRELLGETLDRAAQVNSARQGFAQRAATVALRKRHVRHSDEIERMDELRGQLRRSDEWNKALDRIWPSQSAAALLRRLYGNGPARARVTEGILADDDVQHLKRRPAKKLKDEPWTSSDLVLLDEVENRLNGTPMRFGHIVVDEAQDLSAMGLRMIRRRSNRNSMTVLGDLAQSTKPGGQTSWSEAIVHLGDANTDLVELELGYRLPASILDFASRLLGEAAPGLRPSRSVRLGGDPPKLHPVVESSMVDEVTNLVAELAATYTTVAVLAESETATSLQRVLSLAGHDLSAEEPVVVVMEAGLSKGLEFDAVVVIEPADVVAERRSRSVGLRVLYVAMTRAVQQLHIVHSKPLPEALEEAKPRAD